jgi:hypothetical protein
LAQLLGQLGVLLLTWIAHAPWPTLNDRSSVSSRAVTALDVLTGLGMGSPWSLITMGVQA